MKTLQTILQAMRPGPDSLGQAGQRLRCCCWLAGLLLALAACAPLNPKPSAADRQMAAPGAGGAMAEAMAGEPGGAAPAAEAGPAAAGTSLPVRFQQPSYFVKPMGSGPEQAEVKVEVGADISTTSGPVPLRDIVKRLAALKNMNVSWASDVDQNLLLDVDIRADEDFFQALDNLLRQVDYFHEMEGNTIVIKYKETKKFHIAMPPRLTTVSSSNNAGGAAVTSLSAETKANRWDDVRKNLDQILDIWTTAAPAAAPAAAGQNATAAGPSESPTPAAAAPAAAGPAPGASAAPASAGQPSGKGYYAINESIGLVTVTAPRLLLTRIADYIETLKTELYRQISIEAKIVEVTLNDSSTTGLNWNSLLNNFAVNVQLFGNDGVFYPKADRRFLNQAKIVPSNFSVVLDAIAEQGQTKVLANPKVSVMNGQPAVIYVGDNITYIDKVTSTVSGQSGAVSTTVTTAQVTSGIRLEVYPTIINDKEIIMSLTPMTSGLKEEIEYKEFAGSGGIPNQVGLPKVKERTMNSIVRVGSGEMLVVGGMIDRSDQTDGNKVQLLGELPIIGNLFKSTTKSGRSTELVILLQPRII